MTEWLYNIECSFPDPRLKRSIFYIVSESREIIRTLVNRSAAMQAVLGMEAELEEQGRDLFLQWERDGVIRRCDAVYKTGAPYGHIEMQEGEEEPAALYLTDFHMLEPHDRSRILKAFLDYRERCRKLGKNVRTVLLIASPQLVIPDGFANEIEVIHDRALSRSDICEKLRETLEGEAKGKHYPPVTDAALYEAAVDFVGLTTAQIDNVLFSMPLSLHIMLREKNGKKPYMEYIEAERIKNAEKDSTLRFLPRNKHGIVGQGALDEWLKERAEDFHDPEAAAMAGTPAPKGILLCGVPGTGKSAMAAQIAYETYKVPGLVFDIGRLKNSLVGASEANLRRFLDLIDGYGSCVLLLDEVEKVFSDTGSTHEVTRSMMGQLLYWMQNHKSNVFLYITANSIEHIPPELLRDGRLSGRFFAFLPSRDDLTEMLRGMLQFLGPQFDEKKKLVREPRVTPDFVDILRRSPAENGKTEDKLAGIFDRIAQNAKQAQKDGQYRLPFMTGANLESLVELTMRQLRKQYRREDKKLPYTFADFSKAMVESAASPGFVPQAQSNLGELVEMWLNAQKRQYQDVSKHTLLPFASFRNGEFHNLSKGENAYDSYLIEELSQAICAAWKRENGTR